MKLKVALIGCGRVVELRHLPVLRQLPDADVVAVADVDQRRLCTIADRFGVKERYTTAAELLERCDADVVGVCVPCRFHADVALAALAAGRHVLIEKPLALTLPEADRIIEAAKRAGTKATVGFNLRRHRLVRKARELIRQGAVGKVELVRTIQASVNASLPPWREKRETGGGALLEIATHHADQWRFLFSTEVDRVFAATTSGRWDDENAIMTGWLKNGALAQSCVSVRTSGGNEIEIYGEKGRLLVSCYRFDGLHFRPAETVPGSMRDRLQTLRKLPADLRAAWPLIRSGGYYMESFRDEWRHFLGAIRDGTQPETSLEDGRRALEIVLAASESANLNRSVEISQAPATAAPVRS